MLYRRLLESYGKLLEKRPYLTNTLAGATLGFVGDVVCQFVVEKRETLDPGRNLAFTTFCGWYQGGVDTFIYGVYARVWGHFSPLKFGMVSAIFDNFVHVPLAYLPCFYLTLGAMQGQQLPEIRQEMEKSFLPSWLACCTMWVPFQFVNFAFVPPHYRVLFVNCGCLAWNVIIDYINAKDEDEEVEELSAEKIAMNSTSADVGVGNAAALQLADRQELVHPDSTMKAKPVPDLRRKSSRTKTWSADDAEIHGPIQELHRLTANSRAKKVE
ncbi:unnamed protein product [Amoebophrya sp. A120]|nr:unnamed protein product [Amoebophrya sp. A120]|eukprot:GSA120T00023701001.1